MPKPFEAVIDVEICDSTSDREGFTPECAPQHAPSIATARD
jgi:hypothetical protein